MLKLKIVKQEQGFTLIEVLAAILIATIFVQVVMQLMVVAVISKIRAKEYSQAVAWIQQDLEQYVKLKSNQLLYNANNCYPSSNLNGYADALVASIKGTIPSNANDIVDQSLKTTVNGKYFNLTRTLSFPNDYPFNVLTVSYQVYPVVSATNSSPVTSMGFPVNFTTKVIPYAAFQCQ